MAKRGRPRKNPESVVSFDPKTLDTKQNQREAGGMCEFTLTADNAILLEIAKKYMLVLETVQADDGENMTFDGLMNFLIENALAKLIKKIADQYKMNVNQLKFTLDECPCNGSQIRRKLENEFAAVYEEHRAEFIKRTPVSGTQHELFPELTASDEPTAAMP